MYMINYLYQQPQKVQFKDSGPEEVDTEQYEVLALQNKLLNIEQDMLSGTDPSSEKVISFCLSLALTNFI